MEWMKFKELDKEYPEVIVERRISGFENATDSLASLALVKLDGVKSITANVAGDFKFTLYLHSNYIKGYKFEIITFGYDVRLSPIFYILEDAISEEIFGPNKLAFLGLGKSASSSEEFDRIIEAIFKTATFSTVVGGLIKIAKKEKPSK